MNKPSENSASWATVGKVLTVVGVALGIIYTSAQLYSLYRGEYEISASGDYAPFELPFSSKQLEESFNKIELGLSNDKLKEISPKLDSDERSKIVDEYKKLVKENAPDKFWENFERPKSLWFFTIENQGKKEVTDLKLEVPFEGVARIEKVGESTDLTQFKNVITIGSLRPSHRIKVIVWNKSFLNNPTYEAENTSVEQPYYGTEEIRLTHPNGVVNVAFPVRVRGILGSLILFFYFFSPILILTLLVLLVYGVVHFIQSKKVKTTTTSPKGTSEEIS